MWFWFCISLISDVEFHVPVSHLYTFLGKMSTQVFSSFLKSSYLFF